MRAVVQRVSRAKVTVGGEVTGEIGLGLLVLLGVGAGDTKAAADYLVEKTIRLRIFEDDGGLLKVKKMNLSVADVSGALLVVSQFTLYGDVRRGSDHRSMRRLRLCRRASFTNILWRRCARLVCAAKPGGFRR